MPSRILGLLALACLGLAFGTSAILSGADEPLPKLDPAIEKELAARLVTVKGKELTLTKALKTIADQTGVEVQAQPEGDVKNLNLDKVPFWQAIDTLAKEWDLRVYLYGKDRKIALVKNERGYREMPTSYSDLFRLVMKKVVLVRDLEDDTAGGIAYLEVAWEPR